MARILRLPEVLEMTGLSKATVYRLMGAGTFPAPRQLGPRAVGWPEGLIAEWISARPLAIPTFITTLRVGTPKKP